MTTASDPDNPGPPREPDPHEHGTDQRDRITVRINERDSRAEAILDEQVIGILTVERTRRGIDLIHTVNDPVHRGEGAASVLVRTVFAAIREQDLQVTVICPFVESWIQRHPHEVAGIRFAD